MSDAAPGRVLRLAIVGWGLGELAMGRRMAGATWLLAEAIALVLVTLTTLLFADTTWYLVPFVAGMAFIATWTAQAVAAYRRAQHLQGAIPPTPSRSPAAALAWLAVPLLAWGTGFWLFAAESATPGAVLDRFVTAWPAAETRDWEALLAERPAQLAEAVTASRDRLSRLCADGVLAEDCHETTANLLRDVRFRTTAETDERVSAVAEVVRFERRPSRFLGIFAASELVPVPIEVVLRIELEARSAWFGAARWTIVNAETP